MPISCSQWRLQEQHFWLRPSPMHAGQALPRNSKRPRSRGTEPAITLLFEFELPSRRFGAQLRSAKVGCQCNPSLHTMNKATRLIAFTVAFLIAIGGAFVGGIFAGPWYVEHRSPVDSRQVKVFLHPPSGRAIFPSEVYVELNEILEKHLKGDQVRENYPGLSAHCIVVPSDYGYTAYFWVENREQRFPETLAAECSNLVNEFLWQDSGGRSEKNEAESGPGE